MKITYYCIYCNTELSLSPLKGHIGALYCEKCLRFYPISKNIVDVPEILPDFYRDLTDDKRWLIDNQIDVPLQIIEHEIKMEHLNKRMKFIVNAIKDAMIPYDISGEEYPSLYEKEYLNFFLAQIKEASMILDLACGNGRHLPDLCKNADYVVGLDLSVSNLKRAKVVASKFNNIELVRSDILNLPFKIRSKNVIQINFLLLLGIRKYYLGKSTKKHKLIIFGVDKIRMFVSFDS